MKAIALIAALIFASPAAAQVADFQIVDGGIRQALTETAGDPSRGQAIFVDRQGAHCLLCHQAAGLDEPFQGTLGPDLSDYGRQMDEGLTRLRLVDATKLNPDTVMPSYHRIEALREVQVPFRGRPILAAQDIEDVIAYLSTLRVNE